MNNLNKAKDLYEKAKNQIEEKRFDDALLILERAIEISPNNAEVLSLIGYVHYKLNFKMKTKKEVYEISKTAGLYLTVVELKKKHPYANISKKKI